MGAPEPLLLPLGDPVAGGLTAAIQRGELPSLRDMLAARPELANVRMLGRP
jgi:hypothetical protein